MRIDSEKATILIVDDDRWTLDAFTKLLKFSGYTVFSASGAAQAVDIFEQERPDIVLTDVCMPDMDGLDLLAAIRKIDAMVEVILVTAHGDMKMAVTALRAGAADFVTKPVTRGALDTALFQAHQRITLKRELQVALETLRESETRYRRQSSFLQNVIESLAHPFYVVDVETFQVQMSNAAALEQDSCCATACYGLLHQFDSPCSDHDFPCPLEEIKRTRSPVMVEHVCVDRDNRQRYLQVHCYPIFNDQDEVFQAIEYTLDVTYRREAEEALLDSQRKLSAILNNTQQSFMLFDRECVLQAFNLPAQQSSQLFLGMPLREGLSIKEIAQERGLRDFVESFDRALQGEHVFMEIELQAEAGEETWLAVSYDPVFAESGELVGVCFNAANITARKAAEHARVESLALLRATFESTADGILVVDKQGQVLVHNHRLAEMWKFPENWDSFPHIDTHISFLSSQVADATALYRKVKVYHDRDDARGYETFNLKDGRTFEFYTVPYRIEEALAGRVWDFRDITERVRAENALRVLNDGLEAQVWERTRALEDKIVEHQHTETALLKQQASSRDLAKRLAEAEEAERHRLARELHDQAGQNLTTLSIALKIVRTQLPDAAHDTQKMAAVTARVDDALDLVKQITRRVRDVMDDLHPPALEAYGLLAALRWYSNRFTMLTNIPISVEGDDADSRLPMLVEVALFRIAQEALTNASRHAQASEIFVSLEITPASVRMLVVDNGVGFVPHHPPVLGDRQHWGLQAMLERAESVGGECRVESVLDEGTRVIVDVKL